MSFLIYVNTGRAQCTLSATSSGYNSGYIQVYVLVDQNGDIIAQNTTGTFNSVANGVYQIHALNYNPSDAPIPLPSALIGQQIGLVGSVYSGCYNSDFISDYVTEVCASCVQTYNFCSNETIQVSSSGSTIGYMQMYVLVDPSNYTVISTNTTGDFTSVVSAGNTYSIYALNYNLTDVPNPLPTIGQSILQTGNIYAGCYNSDFLTDFICVNVYPVPNAPVIVSVTQPDCINSTGSIELSGLPSASWTISGSPTGSATGSGATTTISGLVSETYSFIVTDDGSGCASPTSLSATIDPQPSPVSPPIVGTVTQPDCSIPTGSVELSGLPSGAWTLDVSPSGSTATGSGTNTIFLGLTPGTSYTFTVTDNVSGCTSVASTDTGLINASSSTPGTPITGAVVQPDCSNPDASIELTSLPSTGNWTVTEFPGGNSYSGSGTSTVLIITSPGTYSYSVTNDSGCTSFTSSPGISINPAPSVPTSPNIVSITQPTCSTPTGSVELSGLPAVGTWIVTGSPSGSLTGTGTTVIITDLLPGTSYTFTVTNVDGCTSLASAEAVINFLPAGPAVPIGIATQPNCIVATGIIEVTSPLGAFSYSIDGTNFQSSTTFSNVAPGAYTITVQDDNTGCTSSSTSQVIVAPVPTAEIITIDANSSIEEGQSIVINASGNGTISWDNGENGNAITVSPIITTTYCATLTDANGCTDTDCVTITVNPAPLVCGDLFIPTAFSPNGDNTNNSFGVSINLDCIESIDVKVYDRWGEIVFETIDAAQRWDGKFKSKELDPAVFVYVIRIKTTEMSVDETFKGNVSLIK